MWSLGCILAEMFSQQLLFKGYNCTDYYLYLIKFADLDQVHKILQQVGTPSAQYRASLVLKSREQHAFNAFPYYAKRPWKHTFPTASAQFLDLLDKLLQFDPANRLTAAEALKHPFFADVREKKTEYSANFILDNNLESTLTSMPAIQQRVQHEVQMCVNNQIITSTQVFAQQLHVGNDPSYTHMYALDDDEDALMDTDFATTDDDFVEDD